MNSTHPIVDELLGAESAQEIIKLVHSERELPIYQLAFPSRQTMTTTAQEWAQKLFVKCLYNDARPQSSEHDNRLVLHHPDGYRVRAYYASNWLDYKDMRRAYQGQTDVMQSDVADALVREFIGQHALLPKDWHRHIKINELRLLRGLGVSSERLRETSIINALLSYQRITENIPWIGPGSQIVATIEGRDVVAFDRPWRELNSEIATTVRIRPLEEALQELFDKVAKLHGGKRIPRGMFKLDKIEFGYYAMGKHAQQRFLQPAYQVLYRTTRQVAAAVAEVIAAHGIQIEPLGPNPEPVRPPLKHRPVTLAKSRCGPRCE
jgi:hypothetical protein